MIHLLDKLTSSQLLTLFVVVPVIAGLTVTSVFHSIASMASHRNDYLDKPLYGGAAGKQDTDGQLEDGP